MGGRESAEWSSIPERENRAEDAKCPKLTYDATMASGTQADRVVPVVRTKSSKKENPNKELVVTDRHAEGSHDGAEQRWREERRGRVRELD